MFGWIEGGEMGIGGSGEQNLDIRMSGYQGGRFRSTLRRCSLRPFDDGQDMQAQCEQEGV